MPKNIFTPLRKMTAAIVSSRVLILDEFVRRYFCTSSGGAIVGGFARATETGGVGDGHSVGEDGVVG